MNEPAPQTESIKAYAASLGQPNEATTVRMRARLDGYMESRAQRRRRLGLAIAIVLLASAAVALALWPRTPEGVITASDRAQALEVGDGRIQLLPGAEVSLTDDGTGVVLLAGEIEIQVPDAPSFSGVTSGDFTVQPAPGVLRVRRTEAMPVVTVLEGEARVRGPGLPAGGVRILPVSANP